MPATCPVAFAVSDVKGKAAASGALSSGKLRIPKIWSNAARGERHEVGAVIRMSVRDNNRVELPNELLLR